MTSAGALNYTTHAIETLESWLAGLRRNNYRASAHALESLITVMREAVKFNLPEHGELVALETLDEAFSEFVRLPFDAVCLEAAFPVNGKTVPVYRGNDTFLENCSTRRIAVAWTQQYAQRFPALCPQGAREGFYVASVYYDDEDRNWLAAPLLSFIPKNPAIERIPVLPSQGAQGLEYEFLLKQGAVRPNSAGYECETQVFLSEFVHLMAEEMGSVEAALARFSLDLRDETATAIAFCLTVNASNIEQRRMDAPAKLNKKRLSSGKVPFYDTWVLDVGTPTSRSGGRESNLNADDRRGAPRLHLRRGHLRRLGPDRITFVRATTVGTVHQGQVDKVYRVTSPAGR